MDYHSIRRAGEPGFTMYSTHDRRTKPRIDYDFPAIVEGYDDQGNKYQGQAKLADLCVGGALYMGRPVYRTWIKMSCNYPPLQRDLRQRFIPIDHTRYCCADRPQHRRTVWSSYQISQR